MSRSTAGREQVIPLTASVVAALRTTKAYQFKELISTEQVAEFLEELFVALREHPDPLSLDGSGALNLIQDVLRARMLEEANLLKESYD